MNDTSKSAGEAPSGEGPIVSRKRKAKGPHGVQGGTAGANRLAVVILEVLAGMRTPTDAAAALAISLPRYYQLETRALEGLVAALEPRPLGKQPSPESRIAQLEKERDEARREAARQQALVRVAQRSLGIKPPAVEAKEQTRAGRRRRRPAVRALKAAQALRKQSRLAEGNAVQQPMSGAASAREGSPIKEGAPLDGAPVGSGGTTG